MQYIKYVFVGLFVVGLLFALVLRGEDYSPEAFAAIAGFALALVFEYFPFVTGDYDQLPSGQKRLVMGSLVFLSIFGAFALSCISIVGAFVCTFAGGLDALYTFVLAIALNQGTHLVFKRS